MKTKGNIHLIPEKATINKRRRARQIVIEEQKNEATYQNQQTTSNVILKCSSRLKFTDGFLT